MSNRIDEAKSIDATAKPNVDLHFEALDQKSIEQIIFEIEENTTKVEQGRKWALYKTRIISQDAQAAASHAKEESLKSTGTYYCAALSVACQIGAGAGAWFGSQAINGFGTALSKGSDTFGNSLDRKHEACRNALDHTYQRKGSQITDESGLIRETDQGMERSLNTIQRLLESQNRLAESIVAS